MTVVSIGATLIAPAGNSISRSIKFRASLARAAEAFQRGEASTGHGLGLAIVAQIAALHGGSVTFSAPPGLVVRVRFASEPAADRPPTTLGVPEESGQR